MSSQSPPPSDNSGLLTVRDAAKFLAISPRKLWQLTNCGEIPRVSIGRAVRYDPDDLRRWIETKKEVRR